MSCQSYVHYIHRSDIYCYYYHLKSYNLFPCFRYIMCAVCWDTFFSFQKDLQTTNVQSYLFQKKFSVSMQCLKIYSLRLCNIVETKTWTDTNEREREICLTIRIMESHELAVCLFDIKMLNCDLLHNSKCNFIVVHIRDYYIAWLDRKRNVKNRKLIAGDTVD